MLKKKNQKQTSIKGKQEQARPSGKSYSQGTLQENILPYDQMVLEHEMHKIHRNFERQTDHLIQDRKPKCKLTKKTTTWSQMDFAVPVKHRGNSKKTKIL